MKLEKRNQSKEENRNMRFTEPKVKIKIPDDFEVTPNYSKTNSNQKKTDLRNMWSTTKDEYSLVKEDFNKFSNSLKKHSQNISKNLSQLVSQRIQDMTKDSNGTIKKIADSYCEFERKLWDNKPQSKKRD